MQNTQINPDKLFNRETDGFVIKNLLLRACMDLSTSVPIGDKTTTLAGFRSKKESIGYVFLCMLTYKALNFSRDLGTTDRVISDPHFQQTLKRLYKLFIPFYYAEEENAIEELRNLHQHTQNKLSQHFNENNPLVLKRAVKSEYIHHLKRLCVASKLLGYDYILLDMDTLNSYEVVSSTDYCNPAFEHAIIQHPIDISDVLYCSSLVAPKNVCDYIVEMGEWVIVNRSADGLVKIPIDGISFHGELIESQTFNDITKEIAEKIWNNGKPVYISFPHNHTLINELQKHIGYTMQYNKKQTLWQCIKSHLFS